ncbi:heterokaryon incompatibility protein (het-6OR allele) [Fusarium denticulatum]|uniref:Heterokaryon incompatibility protein (Het-6OR allele) n=1 Tax=Fusarium denticulatum TaxID=48507 RepID=A0A8H5TQY9_9HYPO|nr:heterokaryon incompatibility protein (het-6OR allele) [Fusarium denticulatum]
MPASKDSRLYAPLDRSRRQIRLVEILSTKPKIVCNLTTVSLDEDTQFSAISYLWGDKGKTEPTTVNGVEQFITTSLANALEYAPYHWANAFPERDPKSCRLWADALCINQDDDLEKGHQVQLMKFIYPAVEIVFSCLDIEASQSDIRLAFQTCETLVKAAVERGFVRSAIDVDATIEDKHIQELEWLLRHPLLDENCPIKSQEFADAEQAMHQMLRLKYWERAWIFQELVLSRRVVVIHQLLSIDLKFLLDAQFCIDIIKHMASVLEEVDQTYQYFWYIYWQRFLTLRQVDWARVCVHEATNADETIIRSMRGFLLLMGGMYRAKDPKDHVYALLGLTTLQMEPDYSSKTTVASVYAEVCVEIARSQQPVRGWPLCFLSGAGLARQGKNQKYELPSWVYNFPETFGENKSPQELFASYEEPNYDRPEEWDSLTTASIHGDTLTCSAVFFHTIIDASPPLEASCNSWLDFVSAVFRMIHRPIGNIEDPHPLWTLTRVLGAHDDEVNIWGTPATTRLVRILQYLLLTCQVPTNDDGRYEADAAKKAEAAAGGILDKLPENILYQDDEKSPENRKRNESTVQIYRELISQIRDTDSFWNDMDNQQVQRDISACFKLEPVIGLTDSGEFVMLPRVAEIGDQVVLYPGYWQLSLGSTVRVDRTPEHTIFRPWTRIALQG